MSIVVPTYNREEKLNRLLASICLCGAKIDFEIIIVNDSPVPSRIAESNLSLLGKRLKTIRNPKRMFISASKNIGWKEAKGKFVFFIDDDNILPPGTLDTLANKLDSDGRIGALMPVVYYEKKRNLVWVYAAPFAENRWRFRLLGRNRMEDSPPREELLPTDALPNASMVRRDVLEAVNGVDETLSINSSCDLCQRIKRAGYSTFALTTAKIFHDVTLPGTPGYWAEHAAEDSLRRYHEVRDWFDLMARIHKGESLLVAKEFLRSMLFLMPVAGGILMHPTKRKQPLSSTYLSMFRGVKDGLRIASSKVVRSAL